MLRHRRHCGPSSAAVPAGSRSSPPHCSPFPGWNASIAASPLPSAPRCLRLRHDQPAPPLPDGAGLDPLAPADLAEPVCAYHPRTDPEVVARLAARFNNPLPLELICTLPKYLRASARDGALRLDPADIDGLPRRVENIYQGLWDELPQPAQQALALATLAIPEPDQLAIATAARDEHFTRAELDAVLDRLAAGLKAHPLTEPDAETQHCARLLLALHRWQQDAAVHQGATAHGDGLADSDALRAIRLLQRALADQPRELPWRIALGEYLGRLRLGSDDIDLLDARGAYASALGESGRFKDAIDALADLVADQQRIFGANHPDTLTTRNNLAFWRARSDEITAGLVDSNIGPLLIEMDRGRDPVFLATHVEDPVAIHVIRRPEGLSQLREGGSSALTQAAVPILQSRLSLGSHRTP